MFLSYTNTPFTIIDEDFEEACYTNGWDGIIYVYERRKLPIAPNLFRAMVYWCGTSRPMIEPSRIIPLIMRENHAVRPYATELEKYLSLL